MHYKTIKIPLNIHNCNFCGYKLAKFYIATLRAERADFLGGGIFSNFPPPPPPNPKNGSTPLVSSTV